MAVRPLQNEKELLRRVAAGDEHAFTILFQWYGRPLGEFVLRLTNSLQVTQEVVQDTFIKIWLKRENLPAIENFGGYLFIVCRNRAFAALKKTAREPVNAFEPQVLEAIQISEPEESTGYYQELIEAAVGKLPAQQQRVYRLSRYDRLKHDEIARQLGISAETVKKHIQLAVRFIQEDIGTQKNIGIVIVLTTPLMLR